MACEMQHSPMTKTFPWELSRRAGDSLPSSLPRLPMGSFFETPGVVVVDPGAVPAPAAPPTAPGRGGSTLVAISHWSQSEFPSCFVALVSQSGGRHESRLLHDAHRERGGRRATDRKTLHYTLKRRSEATSSRRDPRLQNETEAADAMRSAPSSPSLVCHRRRSPFHSHRSPSLPSSVRPAEYLLLLPLQITEAEERGGGGGGGGGASLHSLPPPLLQPHGSGPFLSRQCCQVRWSYHLDPMITSQNLH